MTWMDVHRAEWDAYMALPWQERAAMQVRRALDA